MIMTALKTVACLFDNKPLQWNLRGDPHLWREMREHFTGTPLPSSPDDLVVLLEAAFETLTGHSISETEPFFTERYNTGGMSSGMVLPKFWREKIIPFILAQFSEI
jgi:hypothetical protein